MRRSLAEAVSEFKRNWTNVIEQSQIERVIAEIGVQWRDRILTPAHTVQLFLLQILHGNTAISHVRYFSGKNFSASAYCQARQRLPLRLFEILLERMSRGLQQAERTAERWRGRRVYLVDGSNFSMPDTESLKKHFGQPTGQKKGCGFPIAHFVALFHAGTGMIVQVLSGALYSHDLSRFVELHPALHKKDVIVGDRGFSSFAHLVLMVRRGVDAVFRINQMQIVNFRAGRTYSRTKKGVPRSRWEKRLGMKDQLVTWFKPKKPPLWMHTRQFQLLPTKLLLRELAYDIHEPGFRSRRVLIVTTLLDATQFPATAIAELYGQRWSAEINFRHLKTTMGMEVLHCQTVDGVLKEFYAFCLVYNLIRTVMLETAAIKKCRHTDISFIDTIRWLIAACSHLTYQPILLLQRRPGRVEPRAVKRRPKQHKLLTKPRNMYSLKALRA